MKLKLAREAIRDLDCTWLYVAQNSGSVETADRLVESIGSTFALLLRAPEAGRLRAEFGSGVRAFPVSGYMVYYRRRGNCVEVLRVIHGMRDQGAAFRS
jgi:toxin ParE1/3/4